MKKIALAFAALALTASVQTWAATATLTDTNRSTRACTVRGSLSETGMADVVRVVLPDTERGSLSETGMADVVRVLLPDCSPR
jgi:hypothetical protein